MVNLSNTCISNVHHEISVMNSRTRYILKLFKCLIVVPYITKSGVMYIHQYTQILSTYVVILLNIILLNIFVQFYMGGWIMHLRWTPLEKWIIEKVESLLTFVDAKILSLIAVRLKRQRNGEFFYFFFSMDGDLLSNLFQFQELALNRYWYIDSIRALLSNSLFNKLLILFLVVRNFFF